MAGNRRVSLPGTDCASVHEQSRIASPHSTLPNDFRRIDARRAIRGQRSGERADVRPPIHGGKRRAAPDVLLVVPAWRQCAERDASSLRGDDGGDRTPAEGSVMSRLLLALIRLLTPPAEREWVVGDTLEEFRHRQQTRGRRW